MDNLSKEFKEKIDLIIDAGKTKVGTASTIIQITDDKINILREGPINF